MITMTRRGLLASGAVVSGSAMVGCSHRTAVPTGTSPKIHLVMQAPQGTYGNPNLNTMLKLFQGTLAQFEQAYPDTRVTIVPTASTNANIAALAAGTGPDLVSDYYPPPYWKSNLLTNLAPYLKRDGVDITIWPQAQMQVFQQPNGTFMLGQYFSPHLYALRLDLFDAAGVAYPDPNWTHTDFANVAKQLTRKDSKGQVQYGAVIQWYSYGVGQSGYILDAFGGELTDPTGTQSDLGKPGSIQAGQWMYQELFWPGYATTRDRGGIGDGYGGFLAGGHTAMQVAYASAPIGFATNLANAKWAFYPFPIFPEGRTTIGTSAFWGINASTPHPEHAWRLLKWLTAEPVFQTAMIQLAGLEPWLNSLWETYIHTLEQVAPTLRNKGLEWFLDAIQKNYCKPWTFYKYDDQGTQAIVNKYITGLWDQKTYTSVSEAFTLAATAATAYQQQEAKATASNTG